MNALCITTDLTSAEWAAWVQAIGSILAIGAAVILMVWQSHLQRNNDLALQRSQRIELAKTLAVMAENYVKAVAFLSTQLGTWDAVYDFAEGNKHFDFEELARLDAAISLIPLHDLPNVLVTPMMTLGATFRVFKEKVEFVMRVHRQMDGAARADFLQALQELNASVNLTGADIARAVDRLKAGSV